MEDREETQGQGRLVSLLCGKVGWWGTNQTGVYKLYPFSKAGATAAHTKSTDLPIHNGSLADSFKS